MKKLDLPRFEPLAIYDVCVSEMSEPLENRYLKNRAVVKQATVDFGIATDTASWFSLPRAAFGKCDQVIGGDLTKKELTDIYSKYFVGSKAEARKIYDEILVSALGKCPYCGGIGNPKTLDHYLPKSRFPLFSVLPSNLVPCCRDCNTGKSSSFSGTMDEQAIHPYLDKDLFFSEKWIFAQIERTDPISAKFFANPPEDWNEVDKSRVRQHFKDYDLAGRYSEQVSSALSIEIAKRSSSLKRLPVEDFRLSLLDVANCSDLPVNGWWRSLYFSLAKTNWFCEADFSVPNGHMATI